MAQRDWSLQHRTASCKPLRRKPAHVSGKFRWAHRYHSRTVEGRGDCPMSSPPMLRVFVADAEAPARRKLLRFLALEKDISVVGEAGNGPDAVAGIQQTRPDLLFLDVQMPGMDGFDVVRALDMSVLPRIIFVTAHDEYAIQAFEVHAFGYLLKPFDQERFSKVLAGARKQAFKDIKSDMLAELQALLTQYQRPLP